MRVSPIRYAGALGCAAPRPGTTHDAFECPAALRARDWSGVVARELLGPRDISYAEATRILGECIGRPELAYVQLSYADMIRALMDAGLFATFSDLYAEMTRAFNEGTIRPRDTHTRAKATPTRFEDFAVELARTYPVASAEASAPLA